MKIYLFSPGIEPGTFIWAESAKAQIELNTFKEQIEN